MVSFCENKNLSSCVCPNQFGLLLSNRHILFFTTVFIASVMDGWVVAVYVDFETHNGCRSINAKCNCIPDALNETYHDHLEGDDHKKAEYYGTKLRETCTRTYHYNIGVLS